MRPRESPASGEAFELLKRAQSLLEKAEKLDMVEHEGKKVPAFAADGKGPEDEKKKGSGKCPSCGGKMDMEKGMCMKAGCGSMKADMKKGEQHKIQTFNFKPETTQFMVETGGNTYHQQYSTNNSLLESEDVANKGASSSSVNLVSLNRNQNPHDNPAPGHQTEG
jgi:hypothetical protein|tara:strand:- start:6 stop:500 length:495 start_codon:yes stop_codon:yes gene_type:complete